MLVGQLIEVGVHVGNERLHSAGTDCRAIPDRPSVTPYAIAKSIVALKRSCTGNSQSPALFREDQAEMKPSACSRTTTARPIQGDGARQA